MSKYVGGSHLHFFNSSCSNIFLSSPVCLTRINVFWQPEKFRESNICKQNFPVSMDKCCTFICVCIPVNLRLFLSYAILEFSVAVNFSATVFTIFRACPWLEQVMHPVCTIAHALLVVTKVRFRKCTVTAWFVSALPISSHTILLTIYRYTFKIFFVLGLF
jgi:hypothetical protein